MDETLANVVVGAIVEGISKLTEISREKIAEKIREVATHIERGDIVPEEAIARARERQKKIHEIRDNLPDESDKG